MTHIVLSVLITGNVIKLYRVNCNDMLASFAHLEVSLIFDIHLHVQCVLLVSLIGSSLSDKVI